MLYWGEKHVTKSDNAKGFFFVTVFTIQQSARKERRKEGDNVHSMKFQ